MHAINSGPANNLPAPSFLPVAVKNLVLALPLLALTAVFGPTAVAQSDTALESDLSVQRLPTDFYLFEPEEYWLEPRDSYWMSFSNWVIGQERVQSKRVQALGAWADRTLSGSPQAAPDNESYLRLGLAAEARTGKLASLEPEARFRVDLPTAEERLRVIVESESDELIPLGERRRDRQLTDDERSDTGTAGALRFLSEVSDTIDLSNDVGVRLRFPTDAFWRARARARWQLGNQWQARVDQRLYYFHQDGWGESTRVEFGRPLSNGWDFISSSEAVWVHDDREFELSQVFNFYKRLNNRAELNPRIGVLGESQPTWRSTDFFADVTWRYRIYHDWLYGEVIPGVEFRREDSFKERTSLLLRVEMFFSGELLRR